MFSFVFYYKEKPMADKKLTEKQDNIFQFIKGQIKDDGFPPTVREIGDKFGITVKGAYDHIKAIEKKGFIKTEQNKSRAIAILGDEDEIDATDAINIPLVGRIAAGQPILAAENIDGYLSFPASMFGSGEFFAVKVKGDSMIDGGIFDGDIAILRKQNTANNGEVVAALLDDEATLKKFKMTGNKVTLIPQNPAYEPIVTTDVTILGKLAAVFRRYK
jgi:repressor LexA